MSPIFPMSLIFSVSPIIYDQRQRQLGGWPTRNADRLEKVRTNHARGAPEHRWPTAPGRILGDVRKPTSAN